MNKRPLPDQKYLVARLIYDPLTGKLYWRARTPDMFEANAKWTAAQTCTAWNTRWAGKEAFTAVNKAGYKIGTIAGTCWLAARIIWKLAYGCDPVEVDHDDRAKANNKLSNLINATRSMNCRNRGLLRNNKSGVSGIYFESSKNLWVVEVNGKRYGRRKDWAAAVILRNSV